MSVSFPRLSLAVSGLLFVGLGGVFVYDPAQVTKIFGLPTPPPALRVALSAGFGGLPVGIGLFFLAAAGRARWIRAALAAQVSVFASLAGATAAGMITQGHTSRLHLLLLVLETGGSLLGLVAFQRAKVKMQEYAARGLL